LENLSDVVEVLFPTLVEDQDVIQVYFGNNERGGEPVFFSIILLLIFQNTR